jgi:hypothetical protein
VRKPVKGIKSDLTGNQKGARRILRLRKVAGNSSNECGFPPQSALLRRGSEASARFVARR